VDLSYEAALNGTPLQGVTVVGTPGTVPGTPPAIVDRWSPTIGGANSVAFYFAPSFAALRKLGGNLFQAQFDIANSASIRYLDAVVSVDTHSATPPGFPVAGSASWSIQNAAIAPEPVSLALMLPGIAPLALLLRRRFKTARSEDRKRTG